MKKLLLIFATLLLFSNVQAQLSDGSSAPAWNLTDINGTQHNLYTYLDSGYTVFIEFTAVWCGPCWSYHNSGTLEDLYMNHGPAGMPNVNPNTTDDVMVFMIEGDGNTVANLGGVGGNTVGDWITGTPYPIICTDGTVNNDDVTGDYQIGYWPTIYMVCPDRTLTEVGQNPNPYSLLNCSPPAVYNNDVRTFDYNGEILTCEGDLVPEITIQNYGLIPLTSLSIEVSVNGSPVSTTSWLGNLTTYAIDNITLPALTGLAANDAVTINATSPNGTIDADPSNNPTISFNVEMATQNTHQDVTVQINTDAYGSETTWDITDDASGAVVAVGGPYNNLSAAGITAQTPVTTTLSDLTCYTFTIYDSYGDGINSGYGAGSFTVIDANGTTLASGGTFTDEDGGAFKTGSSTVEVHDVISSLSIYPNPVKNTLTIEGIYTTVDIFDMFGKLVLSSEYTNNINVSSLANGIYTLNITTEKGIHNQKITISK